MENTTYPTKRQRLAVNKIVQGKSVSRAMLESGYDLTTAKNPKNLTESKGFRQLCEDNGLTESLVISSLVDDIREKPKGRVPELRLASEILGMTEHEAGGNKTLIINIVPETAQRYEITKDTSIIES